MDYVQITDEQRKQMIEAIGVDRIEQLYQSLPSQFRLDRPLDLPSARSELTLQTDLAQLARCNRPAADQSCFLGAGAYDHFIPAVVDRLAGQGQFVTAYTPYQAEASQGALQAFFEFQTQICQLTGLDVANASLYEGATAVAEAIMMALNVTGKRRVLVADTLHPHSRRVLRTYLHELPVELIELGATEGCVDAQTVVHHHDNDTACVVIQSPNVYGLIEDWKQLFGACGADESAGANQDTLGIAVFNPIACGLLRSPGACGADIACGEGQPLGIAMQYGGPYLGLFATRRTLMRKMPGRLVGQTVDRMGRRGYCLTLQTREQHIRGARATSNICTNQGLLALRATIYLSALGPSGLHGVAQRCYQKAHYAADRITAIEGYERVHEKPFFHEFVVSCPVLAQQIIDAGRDRHIAPGLDCHRLGIGDEKQLLIAVTEKRTKQEIDRLADLLSEVR